MLDSKVDSARGFLLLWLGLAVGLLVYAWLDFRMNPWLLSEHQFSMKPDLSQAHELVHWGGRLLRHGALPLLIGNAIVVSGMLALLVHAVVRVVRRARRGLDDRISVVPGSVPTSVRPPSARA